MALTTLAGPRIRPTSRFVTSTTTSPMLRPLNGARPPTEAGGNGRRRHARRALPEGGYHPAASAQDDPDHSTSFTATWQWDESLPATLLLRR